MTDADDACVARILGLLGEDDRVWLADRPAAPWLRRARRLARRDALIRQLGLQHHGVSKVRPLVAAIASALSVYLTGTYRFEADQKPAHPRRGLLWCILTENEGRLPSPSTIRDALAGVRVQKSGSKMCIGRARRPGFGLKSRTSRNVGGSEGSETVDRREG